MITNSLVFNPSTTQLNVEVEVMEDSMSKQRQEFSISIGGIEAIEAPDANLSTKLGGPVKIMVYNNDCECSIRVYIQYYS